MRSPPRSHAFFLPPKPILAELDDREIRSGEFQYMSAGTGVLHSEVNPSPDTAVKLLQIWITPESPGGEPRYQDFDVASVARQEGLALLASPDGRDGSIAIRQNAEIVHGKLAAGQAVQIISSEGRPYNWLQLVRGELSTPDGTLQPGDGATFDHINLELSATTETEFLLFRLS